MKTAVVIGTRPEIIKMAPVVAELQKKRADFLLIHTGQHYSRKLDGVFFDQLKISPVAYNLEAGSGPPGEQTARILSRIEKVFVFEKPDLVLVEGDTNSVLAAALAAAKLGIKVGHVEAGLRSYDPQMPEELNRRLTDHCSHLLFAPTERAAEILKGEGISPGKICITGNTVADAIRQNLRAAKASPILHSLNLKPKEYCLVTLHRQENVDNPVRFSTILSAIDLLSRTYRLPVVYPVHPRSRQKIRHNKMNTGRLKLLEPLDYWSFLELEREARLILTDSGGVQEEACILGTPCVTLRDNTERPETLEIGANLLAGADPGRILTCAEAMLKRKADWQQPFGDGRAAARIVAAMAEP